jgi:hypothetical protein
MIATDQKIQKPVEKKQCCPAILLHAFSPWKKVQGPLPRGKQKIDGEMRGTTVIAAPIGSTIPLRVHSVKQRCADSHNEGVARHIIHQ